MSKTTEPKELTEADHVKADKARFKAVEDARARKEAIEKQLHPLEAAQNKALNEGKPLKEADFLKASRLRRELNQATHDMFKAISG